MLKMDSYSLLDLLKDILQTVNPLREDWAIRFRIINELRDVVQSIESLRGATVEPFGSFVSNLFTRWGDLDISIELPNGSYISSAGKKHKQSLLGEVLIAMRKKGGYRKLQFIANAKVPILKLESSYHISCDISVNNLSGQMKSKMLFWINEIDPRFRDLVLLIKEWAKAQNINDPKSGTLNSYSLSLLVIFHLQTCVPAILPPLKEIYPGNMVDDLTGVRADVEKHIEETCEVQIKKSRNKFSNRTSLSELFISFLAKFSGIGERAASQGISTYSGQWEDIKNNMRWLPKTYSLFIEDPFEQPVNTARTVSGKQLIKISEAFQTSYQLLTSANHNQTSLVSTLVRPQIAQFVQTRRPVQNQYHNGSTNVRPHPQIQQMMHSPKQQEFQNSSNGMNVRLRPQVQPTMHSPRQRLLQNKSGGAKSGDANFRYHPQVQHIMRSPRSQLSINPSNDVHWSGPSHGPIQSSNGQMRQVWRPKSDR